MKISPVKALIKFLPLIFFYLILTVIATAQKPSFKVLVVASADPDHDPMIIKGKSFLEKMGKENSFEVCYTRDASLINDENLSQYQVFVQMHLAPFDMTPSQQAALQNFISTGKGWVGFHHATLLGEFDGYPMWKWFSDFMGGIRFDNYIAATASAKVNIEDLKHPVVKGISPSFIIDGDEWYTFNKNPRPNVKVLASVDESTYDPASDIKMEDHPVVWVNEKKMARNVYFLMGHDGSLLKNNDFTTMVSNALMWAAGE